MSYTIQSDTVTVRLYIQNKSHIQFYGHVSYVVVARPFHFVFSLYIFYYGLRLQIEGDMYASFARVLGYVKKLRRSYVCVYQWPKMCTKVVIKH